MVTRSRMTPVRSFFKRASSFTGLLDLQASVKQDCQRRLRLLGTASSVLASKDAPTPTSHQRVPFPFSLNEASTRGVVVPARWASRTLALHPNYRPRIGLHSRSRHRTTILRRQTVAQLLILFLATARSVDRCGPTPGFYQTTRLWLFLSLFAP